MRNKANSPSGETYFLWVPGSLCISLHLDIRESDRASLLPSPPFAGTHSPFYLMSSVSICVCGCVSPSPTHSYIHAQALTQTTDPVIPQDPFFQPKWLSGLISSFIVWAALTVKVGHMSHSHFNQAYLQSHKIVRVKTVALESNKSVSLCHSNRETLQFNWELESWVNNLFRLTGMLIEVRVTSAVAASLWQKRLRGFLEKVDIRDIRTMPLGNQRVIRAPTCPLWHSNMRIWA